MSHSLPILYFDHRSPCNRSVLMLISALGLSIEYKFVDLFKVEHKQEWFLKVNPFHTVPCLSDKDVHLMDSHAILMYLCDTYGKGTVLEIKGGRNRAIIMDRLMFHATKQFEWGKVIMVSIVFKVVQQLTLNEVLKFRYTLYKELEAFLQIRFYGFKKIFYFLLN